MSAIRPLATIAMLMVLGYFLWTRINTPGLEASVEAELALADIPPLSLEVGDGGSTLESSPPVFSPAEPTTGGTPAPEFEFGPAPSPPATNANRSSVPLGSENATGAATMPDLPPLPANVPTADYSDGTSDVGTASGAPSARATDSLPPLETTSPLASDTNPITPEEGSVSPTASPMGVEEEFGEATSAFAAARTAIDAALRQGELERAHVLLSGWYGDRSLTPEQRDEVETLLSQLAGTVVYSPQHRLEPPHTVQAGETLETIAQKYEVPWQLLGKINGVPEPSAVRPGQELKVVRGPFSAVVDIERQQLALMVANRYAGRFSVKTEGQATNEGEWVVMQKQMPTGYGATSKQIVLEPAGGAGGETSLVLGPASDTAPATAGAIRVGPTDQEDLFDILSIGSRVIIRK